MDDTTTESESNQRKAGFAAVTRHAQAALRISQPSAAGSASLKDPRAARMERRFVIPTIVAALLIVPVILIEESDPASGWSAVATIGDWVIWGTFVAELLSVTAVSQHRLRWLGGHPLELAIVLLTPPFAPLALQSARAFRLLRLLRLALSVRRMRAFDAMAGLKYAAVVALFGVLSCGAAFATVEKNQHLSTWDGVWWALSTVSTVGYGDIVPHTDEGRVIAIVVMFIGVGFVATLTSALVHFFQAQRTDQVNEADQKSDVRHADIMDLLDAMNSRLARLEVALSTRQQPSGTPPSDA